MVLRGLRLGGQLHRRGSRSSPLQPHLLGTLIAASRWSGYPVPRAVDDQSVDLPAMAHPEVVLGSSLLALFLNILIPLGFWTVGCTSLPSSFVVS